MNLWQWFVLAWIPAGRAYLVIWELIVIQKITLKKLLFSPFYHKQIVLSGIFGLLSPFVWKKVNNKNYLSKYQTVKEPSEKKEPIHIQL